MSSCTCREVNASEVVSKIIEEIGREPQNLLPILHEVQRAVGHISPDCMECIAEELGVSVSQVHGTTTFFTLFYTKPTGKYVVRLCDSTPCHIEGSKAIQKKVADELGIGSGCTTEDGLFSFEIVACMGLCGVAPAMMVNDDVYGNLEPDMVPEILNKYKEAK